MISSFRGVLQVLAFVCFVTFFSLPALAGNERLDSLYAQLKQSETQSQADATVDEIWKEWFKSGDPSVDWLMNAAVTALDKGHYKIALATLNQVVEEAPEFAEGWNSRATVLFLIGAYDRSVGDIAHTLALEPRHFGAMAGLGKILLHQGRFEEALAIYRKALAVNPFLVERETIIPMLERAVAGREI